MSDTKHRYVVRIEAENGQVVSAQLVKMGADGEKSLTTLAKGATLADERFSLLSRTILSRIVPVFSAGALIGAVKQTISSLGDLKDAAEKVGVSAEKLQVFRILGEDAGLHAEESDQALATFVKHVGEAENGTGKLVNIFKAYNISLKNADGSNRSFNAILADYIRLIANAADDQDRLFLATRAFGDEGAKLGLQLAKIGGDLEGYGKKAKEAGLIIDENIVKSADQFEKEWNRVLLQWEVNFKSKIVEIVKALKGIDLNSTAGIDDRIAELQARKSTGVEGFFEQGELESLLKRRAAMQPTGDEMRAQWLAQGALVSKNNLGGSSDHVSVEDRIKAIEAEKELKKRVDDVTAALQARIEVDNRAAELMRALHQAGVSEASEEGQKIKELVDHYYDLKDAEDAQRLAARAAKREMDLNRESAERFGSAVKDLTENFSDLRSVGLRALGDLLQSLINIEAGGKATSSLGGLLATGLESIFNPTASRGKIIYNEPVGPFQTAPAHDYIGPYRGNQAYKVGVPEIFVPGGSQGGMAYPIDKLGGGMKIEYLDARGTDPGTVDNLVAQLKAMGARIEQVDRGIPGRAITAVQNKMKRTTQFP